MTETRSPSKLEVELIVDPARVVHYGFKPNEFDFDILSIAQYIHQHFMRLGNEAYYAHRASGSK